MIHGNLECLILIIWAHSSSVNVNCSCTSKLQDYISYFQIPYPVSIKKNWNQHIEIEVKELHSLYKCQSETFPEPLTYSMKQIILLLIWSLNNWIIFPLDHLLWASSTAETVFINNVNEASTYCKQICTCCPTGKVIWKTFWKYF